MTTKLETTNLVKHYFNICNTALAAHRDSAVYGSLLAVLNELASGDAITLKVVDDSGEDRHFTTRFIDGEFTPIREGEHDTDARFVLERAFLEKVVKNSDDFVENPGKLDWSWLRRRDLPSQ